MSYHISNGELACIRCGKPMSQWTAHDECTPKLLPRRWTCKKHGLEYCEECANSPEQWAEEDKVRTHVPHTNS